MAERRVREAPERRMLLDLQVIQTGAGPGPAPITGTVGGGFAPRPRRRTRILEPEWTAVLYALGLLSETETAALIAQE